VAVNSAVGDGHAVMSADRILVYDGNLRVLETLPFFKSMTLRGSSLKLEWEGWGSAKLEHSTGLAKTQWAEIPGSSLTNAMMFQATEPLGLFRLKKE
jgi:hypothetical protein